MHADTDKKAALKALRQTRQASIKRATLAMKTQRKTLKAIEDAFAKGASTVPEIARRTRIPLPGEVPSPINPPSGCAFHPRCPLTRRRAEDLPADETVRILSEGEPVRIVRRCIEQEPRLLPTPDDSTILVIASSPIVWTKSMPALSVTSVNTKGPCAVAGMARPKQSADSNRPGPDRRTPRILAPRAFRKESSRRPPSSR